MFHAPASFYPVLNGGDAAILYTFAFLLFVFTGPGAWSLDGILRQRKTTPAAA
jgi:putative oxidoreductase